MSDFIKAFIKFHGHVYLCKSLDKLEALREKLEEQFQVSFRQPPESNPRPLTPTTTTDVLV